MSIRVACYSEKIYKFISKVAFHDLSGILFFCFYKSERFHIELCTGQEHECDIVFSVDTLNIECYGCIPVCVGEFEQAGRLIAVLIVYSELDRAVVKRCSACNGYLIRTACKIEVVEFDNNVVAYLLNA